MSGSIKHSDIVCKCLPSNPINRIIYYERRPSLRRPTAILYGVDWSLTDNDFKEREEFTQKKGIITVGEDDGKQQIDSTKVKHSNDLLIIQPKNDSNFYIYGEKEKGLKIGPKSVVEIRGILQVLINNEIRPLDGGRHTIDVINGGIKFVICDENQVLMIGDNYQIDDESYLDNHS